MIDAPRGSVRRARSDRTSRLSQKPKQTGPCPADLEEISGHPAVSAQKPDIVVLRAFAGWQRNRNHVLGLAAIKPIELALPVIGRAEPGAAIAAFEIGEENPLVGVAGEELAVPLGAQRLRRRRRGNPRPGACRRRAAAGTRLDAKVVVERAGHVRSAIGFDLFDIVHGTMAALGGHG